MDRAGLGSEFHANFGSGRVGFGHLWVGLGWVNKIGPVSSSVRCTNPHFTLHIQRTEINHNKVQPGTVNLAIRPIAGCRHFANRPCIMKVLLFSILCFSSARRH